MALAPAILGQAVAEILERIDLDEVVLAPPELPVGHFDVALVSGPSDGLDAALVVEVPVNGGPTRISGTKNDLPIPLLTPTELVELLDRFCAAAAPRVAHLAMLIPRMNGDDE